MGWKLWLLLALVGIVGIFLVVLTFFGNEPDDLPPPSNISDKFQKSDFLRPFAENSIWNTKIPTGAEYVDIQEAIWGNPDQPILSVGLDLTTICYIDETQSLVDFRLTEGWSYPQRSQPRGPSLFQRRLSTDACTDVRFPSDSNGNVVIIDLNTGLADEIDGAWREPGGDVLILFDNPKIHNIDLINGNGIPGVLAAAGFDLLSGIIRPGEINEGINHALRINLPSLRFSNNPCFVSPAVNCDSFADNLTQGYLGSNPSYTMGALLAIPPDVDIDSIAWETPQGKIIATAAQEYGMYIGDASGFDPNWMQIAWGREAAYEDLGYSVDPDPYSNAGTFNPEKVDAEGLSNDFLQVLRLVKAV